MSMLDTWAQAVFSAATGGGIAPGVMVPAQLELGGGAEARRSGSGPRMQLQQQLRAAGVEPVDLGGRVHWDVNVPAGLLAQVAGHQYIRALRLGHGGTGGSAAYRQALASASAGGGASSPTGGGAYPAAGGAGGGLGIGGISLPVLVFVGAALIFALR